MLVEIEFVKEYANLCFRDNFNQVQQMIQLL